MKETRLQEDAYIYKRREEPDEKQKWKDLDGAGKLQYFKDYYLKKLIIIAIVAVCAGKFLITLLTPAPETDLYAAVINSSAPKEKEDALVETIAGLLESETPEAVVWDSSYFINLEEMDQGSLGAIQRFSAQTYTKMIDIVIADEDEFSYFAKTGCFMDLAEALPTNLYSSLSDDIYLGRTEEENNEGIVYGEETAYGIYLKDSSRFKDIATGIENPVFGIVANTEHEKNVIKTLKYLTK